MKTIYSNPVIGLIMLYFTAVIGRSEKSKKMVIIQHGDNTILCEYYQDVLSYLYPRLSEDDLYWALWSVSNPQNCQLPEDTSIPCDKLLPLD